MLDIDWTALVLLMGTVLMAALYGLAASGHFPAEVRPAKLQRGWGALLLWATMLSTTLASAAALLLAARALPWYATVLGGGASLLFAPLLLQLMPDSFVNGRRGLLLLAAGAAVLAWVLWLDVR